MSEERKSVPLFLCCAEDNEVTLVRVVEALQKEGFNPEVVAGVDGDGSLLGTAVDNADSRSLFVICRSTALDRSHVRRLEGLFSARRGPQQRSLTVSLVDDKPLEIMPAIREAMKSLLSAPPESMRPSAELNRDLMRDVIGAGSGARDERVEAEREELARKLHEEMVAAEALLTRRDSGAASAAKAKDADTLFDDLPDEPAPLSDGVPSAPLPEEGTVQLGAADEDESTIPLPDVSPPTDGSASALPYVPQDMADSADDMPIPEDLEAGDSGKAPAKKKDEKKKKSVPPVAAADDDELAADSIDEDTNEEEVGARTGRHSTEAAAEREEQPVSRGMVYAGIVGLAAAVVMAVSFMGAEPDTSDAEIEAAVDRAKAKAQARNKATATKPPVVPAGTMPKPTDTKTADPAPDVKADPTPPVGDPPPAVVDDPPPQTNDSADTKEPPPEPEPEPKPEEPPPKPPADTKPVNDSPPAPPADDTPTSVDPQAKAIKAAIASGALEELGSKVVSMGKESQTWSQANRACRKRNVDGVAGFRLPNQKELKRMKKSGVLDGDAYYWTRDKAESDDEAWALDPRTGDVNVYLKMESIARAACVRRK